MCVNIFPYDESYNAEQKLCILVCSKWMIVSHTVAHVMLSVTMPEKIAGLTLLANIHILGIWLGLQFPV